MREDGSLLAINLNRNDCQAPFRDADIDLLCRLGEPLFSCMNLHVRLSAATTLEGSARGLTDPLKDLPRREKRSLQTAAAGMDL